MHLEIPPGDFAATIFDLDGTLIDSMPVHYRAWDAAMRDFGLKERLDEDYFYALGGMPTTRVAELFGQRYGLTFDPREAMEHKERLYLGMISGVEPIAPVVAYAKAAAARQPVAVATGGMPDVAEASLRALGLRELFGIVVTPVDVAPGRGKPAPDMFLLAAAKMRVAPERCLVFEDAEPGIVGATAAGMTTVRVPSRRAGRRA